MASFCRSAAIVAVRAAAAGSRTLNSIPRSPSLTTTALLKSRSLVVSALGAVDLSLMPLHSAIASSRLRSSIGVDASCWTCLSQGP